MSGVENPSAFPFSAEYGHPAACGGMTLRDWFAGQAMPETVRYLFEVGPVGQGFTEAVARLSYQIADAMLAERAKGGAA